MATSQGGYVDGGFDLLKAPDAPTITSVTTSIGSMSVAFTAPANPGGSAVTGYTVTAVNESTGASVGATGSASPISVSTGGGGTFKVRSAATNIYGPGRVSAFNTGNVVFSGAELETWGRNTTPVGTPGGQLGQGNVILRSSPVQVGALTNWYQVSAGQSHGSSVKTDGTLWAWGSNRFGKLGDGTAVYRSSPVQIGALTDWREVSAGSYHTISVKTDGTLWGWGRNIVGQAGLGPAITYRSSPVQVGVLTNWYQISTGTDSSFSIKTDGTLWAFGNNNGGLLGDNTVTNRTIPVQIGLLTNWRQISSGGDCTSSIKTDGTLWTWGTNGSGQLGQNDRISRSSPVQVGGLVDWALVSAGNSFMSAVKSNGTLWSWGQGGGRLGDNTVIARSSPVQIGALTNWSQVSAGQYGAAAVKTDGTLWTWGDNSYGQLGDGTVISRSSPVQIGGLTSWYQVSSAEGSSSNFTLALYGVT